ncbi:MAG: PKD domain-containing protein, partial [Candidatus Woesearchaeota archaeon]
PLTVEYSCSASGGNAPVSYAISFGDGTTSTNKQGSKTYAQAGTYDIKCTAVDALHNQISTKASVTVNPKVSELKSVFTVDPKEGFAPLKVDYHCSASGGLAPYSYSINFGDSTGSNSPVGSHVYDVPGKYKVSCLVMDYSGQSVMKHHYVNVKDKPPMTDMSFSIVPDEGYAPLKTDYHCSVKGGVGPISYHVSFGDGTSVNNNMGSKTYSNPGSYVATCTAKDAVGQTISSQKKVNVLESKDFTGIDFNVHPKEGFAPLTVEYSCSASGGNAPVSYAISFGDGTSSNSKEGTKTYTQPGSYEVKCTAVDVLDNEISKSVFVTVKPKVPELTVSLDANPLQGFAPLEVDYYCSASGGKAPYSYELSFSDGTTSDDNVGSKVYDEPGNYLLSCKVTDSMNNVRVASKNILVNDKPIMSDIVFDVDPTEGVAPLTIEYNCSVQGGVGPISYHINFCDGTSVNNNVGSKTYSNPGVYVAVCTAKDAIGKILIATQEIIVKEKIPVTEVVFDISPKVGDAPLEVQYSCNAVGGTGHITYDIVFGDGTITNSNAGSHVYNNPGVYNAVCTATDSIGQEMSSSIIVTVKEPYDDIDFESITFNVQPQSGFAPLEVSYSCSVVGGNDPVTITMDFGVGSGSTTLGRQTQGVFLYNTPGTYNMRCTAVDNDGDAISSVRTINVFEVDDREWSIMANPLSGNAPLTVRFDADTTEFGNAIVTWDFKTGHKATGNSVIHVFPRPGTYDVTASFLDENSIYRKKSVTITVLRADEKEELVDGGLLIRGFIAEVSGGRLYVTATIISESTTTMNNIRVQLMLPENDIYEAKMIRTLRAGERTSVSFIVPIDNMRIDTFAVLTASSNNAYTRQMRPLMG